MAEDYPPLPPLKMLSYPARINVRGGKPICPCCNDPMVELEPGMWRCAFYDVVWRKISEQMAEAIDAVLGTDEKGS